MWAKRMREIIFADESPQNSWLERSKAKKMYDPEHIEALRKFTERVIRSERSDTFLMPMFDGLGMGRLVDRFNDCLNS